MIELHQATPDKGIPGELGRHSALLEANYVLFIGKHVLRGIRVFE